MKRLNHIKFLIFLLPVLIMASFPNSPGNSAAGQFKVRSQGEKSLELCISQEELRLYDLIMEYRREHKLPVIALSRSLTYVARQHTIDLATNHPHKDTGCNLHSWSDKGPWTSCCYTPDHEQANCMWGKPGELTNYKDYGFEIVAFGSSNDVNGITAERALDIWIDSSSHNAVILNLEIWNKAKWQAIGISIYEGYASVWFGTAIDEDGEPDPCE